MLTGTLYSFAEVPVSIQMSLQTELSKLFPDRRRQPIPHLGHFACPEEPSAYRIVD